MSDGGNYNSRVRKSSELFIHEMIWPDKDIPLATRDKLIADGHLRLIWPTFNFVFVFLALSVLLNLPYSRKSSLTQYIYVFAPIIIVSGCHFTLQKFVYRDLNYIFLCYLNIFICIIYCIWQNNNKL